MPLVASCHAAKTGGNSGSNRHPLGHIYTLSFPYFYAGMRPREERKRIQFNLAPSHYELWRFYLAREQRGPVPSWNNLALNQFVRFGAKLSIQPCSYLGNNSIWLDRHSNPFRSCNGPARIPQTGMPGSEYLCAYAPAVRSFQTCVPPSLCTSLCAGAVSVQICYTRLT